jgi:hypothetical protein
MNKEKKLACSGASFLTRQDKRHGILTRKPRNDHKHASKMIILHIPPYLWLQNLSRKISPIASFKIVTHFITSQHV